MLVSAGKVIDSDSKFEFFDNLLGAILIWGTGYLILHALHDMKEDDGSSYLRISPQQRKERDNETIAKIVAAVVLIAGAGLLAVIAIVISLLVTGIAYNRGFVTYQECYKEGHDWADADFDHNLGNNCDYEHYYKVARIGSEECTKLLIETNLATYKDGRMHNVGAFAQGYTDEFRKKWDRLYADPEIEHPVKPYPVKNI
jgi:hypothetical protein